jgi:isocitrate lyase
MSTKLNEKQLIAVHLIASGVRASVIANQQVSEKKLYHVGGKLMNLKRH